ncbi:MAG: flagellar basal body P-ring protein FlgI [Phycisphaerae bacterium]|nr:flagellar basal body P-ring protein FlgI [Phycisphaerae bacterium]
MLVAAVLLIASSASAVKIDDICKIKGQRVNKLMGMGLVLGLPGTGDGGKYLPAIRPLAATLSKFANPVISPEELKNANNVALVMIIATVPENGVREGDAIDVQVSSIGAAKSLAGGRLFMTPLQGPNQADSTIYAWAEGPLVVEDVANQRVAVVRQGAVMEEELFAQFVKDSQITLVLQDGQAGWAMAAAIATIINEAESQPGRLAQIAVAFDPKNVIVKLSPQELKSPAGFISRVLNLEVVMPPTEARVTVNERTGTIVMTGDVEIGPVAISHKGLSITTLQPAPPPGTAVTPQPTEQNFVALDPGKEGSTKLSALLEALNQLKVSPGDRIAIIKMIHRTGKLHAELIVE